MPFHALDIAFEAIGYEQRLVLRSAKTAISEIDAFCSTDDSGFGNPV